MVVAVERRKRRRRSGSEGETSPASPPSSRASRKKGGGPENAREKGGNPPQQSGKEDHPPFLDGRKYEGRKRGGVRGGNRSVDRRYGIARAAAEQATDADRYGAVDPDRKGKKKTEGKEEMGERKWRARIDKKTKDGFGHSCRALRQNELKHTSTSYHARELERVLLCEVLPR